MRGRSMSGRIDMKTRSSSPPADFCSYIDCIASF